MAWIGARKFWCLALTWGQPTTDSWILTGSEVPDASSNDADRQPKRSLRDFSLGQAAGSFS
jgi:hypothetical protein